MADLLSIAGHTGTPESQFRNQVRSGKISSLAASEPAISSASHEERATLGCFLEAQLMQADPKLKRKPTRGMFDCPVGVGHARERFDGWLVM